MTPRTVQGYRDRAKARWRERKRTWWRYLRCPDHANRKDFAECRALDVRPSVGHTLAVWCPQCADYWLVRFGSTVDTTSIARRVAVQAGAVTALRDDYVPPSSDHVTPDPFD